MLLLGDLMSPDSWTPLALLALFVILLIKDVVGPMIQRIGKTAESDRWLKLAEAASKSLAGISQNVAKAAESHEQIQSLIKELDLVRDQFRRHEISCSKDREDKSKSLSRLEVILEQIRQDVTR